MNIELFSLCSSIHECTACSFRIPEITPLAPSLVNVPVIVMFIGENPSWAEEQTEPFSSNTISGDALEKFYLKPLELKRSQVWITDLFKCRYPKEIYRAKSQFEHQIQANAETCASKWLVAEIMLAQPKIIVTLSDRQVYQRLRTAFSLSTPKSFEKAVGKSHRVSLGQLESQLFPMVHPDISRPIGEGDGRKENARQKWAPLHSNIHIPALKSLVESITVG